MKKNRIQGIAMAAMLLFSLSFSQGKFGLGGVVGNPLGVSCKYWVNDAASIDGILGVGFVRFGSLTLVGDYTHHWADLTPVSEGKFVLGLGLGAIASVGSEFGVGLRFKGLADYVFQDMPVNIFIEIAPAIIIVEPGFEMTGGLGVRWFFRN